MQSERTLSHRREAVVLVAVCAFLFVSGSADTPFYTRGEPREALVAREMVRTGQWLVPSRPDDELTRKPPLYYWTAAAVLAVFPDRPELSTRLPSAIFGTAAVIGTWAAARTLIGATAGLPAALVLASSLEWSRAASAARVDMALAAPLTAVLLAWMLALAGDRRHAVLATLGAAAATLAKGPVGLVVPALAVGGLALAERDLAVVRRLRVVPVLTAAALIAAVWYGVAFLREGAAFLEVVVRENLLRFVDTDEGRTGHAHGFFYLWAVGLIGLIPWTPLLPLAFVPFRERPRPPAMVLAATWTLAVLGFFSLAAAKRSVYLLPLFPAVALLIAAGAARAPAEGRIATALRVTTAIYLPALAGVALLGLGLSLGFDLLAPIRRFLTTADAGGVAVVTDAAVAAGPAIAALALATLVAVVAVERHRRRAEWRALLLLVGWLAVAWTGSFNGLIRPALGRLQSVDRFMLRVASVVGEDDVIYVFPPVDQGVRFYAPRPLRPFPKGGLERPAWVLAWESQWRPLRDGAGRPLEPTLSSDARQAGGKALLLVSVPPGPLHRARDAGGAPPEPGLRKGSPPP